MLLSTLLEELGKLDPSSYVFVGTESADSMLGDVKPSVGAGIPHVILVAESDFLPIGPGYREGYERGYKDYADGHAYNDDPAGA